MENQSNCAEKIYNELIGPIEDRMIATVIRIVRRPEDASDVFQEVQAHIWRKLKMIHKHPNPHAYIMRVCVSRSYDALRNRSRRSRREVQMTDSAMEGFSARPTDSMVNNENVAAIHQAVASLPTTQGKALLLRVMDDEPYNTIALILGCSEVTARSHVSKARARMQELLGELGILQTRGRSNV